MSTQLKQRPCLCSDFKCLVAGHLKRFGTIQVRCNTDVDKPFFSKGQFYTIVRIIPEKEAPSILDAMYRRGSTALHVAVVDEDGAEWDKELSLAKNDKSDDEKQFLLYQEDMDNILKKLTRLDRDVQIEALDSARASFGIDSPAGELILNTHGKFFTKDWELGDVVHFKDGMPYDDYPKEGDLVMVIDLFDQKVVDVERQEIYDFAGITYGNNGRFFTVFGHKPRFSHAPGAGRPLNFDGFGEFKNTDEPVEQASEVNEPSAERSPEWEGFTVSSADLDGIQPLPVGNCISPRAAMFAGARDQAELAGKTEVSITTGLEDEDK